MKKLATAIAMLGTAILASFCCLPIIGAIIFNLLGLGAIKFLANFRPLFIALNIITLVIAGYFTYRKPKNCCDPKNKIKKIFFWLITAINFLILAYPYF